MALEETNISKKIMLKISTLGCRLFRNNVGIFFTYTGDTVKCGLHKGSSDLIGWKSTRITPDMVGDTIAIFTSIEVKTGTGRLRPEQKHWIEQVKNAGGIAFCARSADDAAEEINNG